MGVSQIDIGECKRAGQIDCIKGLAGILGLGMGEDAAINRADNRRIVTAIHRDQYILRRRTALAIRYRDRVRRGDGFTAGEEIEVAIGDTELPVLCALAGTGDFGLGGEGEGWRRRIGQDAAQGGRCSA